MDCFGTLYVLAALIISFLKPFKVHLVSGDTGVEVARWWRGVGVRGGYAQGLIRRRLSYLMSAAAVSLGRRQ